MLATLACAAIACPGVAHCQSDGQAGFLIVVNADNPVTTLTCDEVARYFLRKVSTWGDGRAVAPVDQAPESEARLAFTRGILRRKPTAVRAYWQQRIFSGRELPPPVRNTDAEVLRFVAENPGAIGYVSPGTELHGPVRILDVAGAGR